MRHFLLLVAAMMVAFSSVAQTRTVTGKVVDNNGQPLPGVNIVIKGTTTGTITDFDGTYKVDAKASDVLVFSFLGYLSQEIPAAKSVINVTLKEDTKSLDEVVVVGYGTQKKSDITGAVASIGEDQLKGQPVSNVSGAMQGRVAGVQITSNSGAPGSALRIRVRGIGSVNNSDPLYVVDGVPVDDIDYLNPSDIASVEILKDASAQAIYGSRGANGVVLITTKSGKANSKAKVTLDAYYGFQNVIDNWNTTTGPEWYKIEEELNKTRTYPADLSVYDKNQNTNWMDAITRTAPMKNVNFRVSGGSKDLTYSLSLGYLDQQGTVLGTDFSRYTTNLNVGYKVSDHFRIGSNISIFHDEKHYIDEEDYHVGIINTAIKLEPVVPVWADKANGVYGVSPNNDYPNPLAAINLTHSAGKKFQFVGNVFGELTLAKGLKIKTSYGQYSNWVDSYNFTPTYDISINQVNKQNQIARGYTKFNHWTWDNTIHYDTKIGKNSISALGGFSMEDQRYETLNGSATNVPNEAPSMWYVSAGADGFLASGTAYEKTLVSFLGRINYSYDSKYLATVNFRADASSQFPKANKWGYFPSVALGWKISQEEFLKNVSWLSLLKLRLGWGQIGNQSALSPYPYQETVSGSKQYRYLFGNPSVVDQGYVVTAMEDQTIKWETVESSNIGVDAAFFDNRLSTSVDYYYKKNKDMLMGVPIPYYYGYETGPTSNVGSMYNKGLELTVDYKDKLTSKLSYEVGFNLSTVKNKVTSLGEDGNAYAGGPYYTGNATRTEVGKSFGYFYGYKTDGLFQSQAEIDAAPVQQGTHNEGLQPGDLKFVDVNGDGVVNSQDETYLGSPLPKFTYGFHLGANYGAFDLSAAFQGTYGNKIFNAMKVHLYQYDLTNKSKELLDAWTPTNTNTNVPRLNAEDKNNTNRISDRYVEDGSYLRLKNVTLGYTLPSILTKKAGVQNVRIYFTGQNLLTFTKYTGADPEVGQQSASSNMSYGVDIGTYPQARTYAFGVKIDF